MHKLLIKALVALSATSLAAAQLSSVPDINAATSSAAAAASSSAAAATSSAAAASSAASTTNAASTTAASTSAAATSTGPTSSFPPLSSGVSSTTITSTAVITSGSTVFTITSGFPTIAGAGIPTMIVPNTAGAPFMRQSNMPEGTVFIAVGSVLAFFGACVLLWRAIVAWSINRSVKQAALASIRGGSEKTSKNWGGAGSGYNPAKGGAYHDLGSSVSMEALTPTGKQIKSPFKDHDAGRNTPPPPTNLFFSPTARNNVSSMYSEGNRSSAYLPAGYYAQPSSHVAGGARNTIIGGTVPPYARNSAYEPTPPGSPALRPATSGGLHTRVSHDTLRAPPSRDGPRNTIYSQASNSSLTANIGAVPGSRAPSAYLEDLFENHTAMASRDRF